MGRRPQATMVHKLFAYASADWEKLPPENVSLLQASGAVFDPVRGAYVIECLEPGRAASVRKEFLDARILCTHKPVPPGREVLWRDFLTGRRSPYSFNLRALVLGPLWMLFQGLLLKTCVLLGAASWVHALGTLAFRFAELPGRRYLVPVELAVLLWLYPALRGEHDLYLNEALREPLWPSLRYQTARGAAAAFVLLGLIAALAVFSLPTKQ